MVDAPEKIWIAQDDCPYFYEESELTEVDSLVTEYIRADIHARALLEAHQRGRREGMEEAAEAVQAYRYEHKFVCDRFAQLIRSKIKEAKP